MDTTQDKTTNGSAGTTSDQQDVAHRPAQPEEVIQRVRDEAERRKAGDQVLGGILGAALLGVLGVIAGGRMGGVIGAALGALGGSYVGAVRDREQYGDEVELRVH